MSPGGDALQRIAEHVHCPVDLAVGRGGRGNEAEHAAGAPACEVSGCALIDGTNGTDAHSVGIGPGASAEVNVSGSW